MIAYLVYNINNTIHKNRKIAFFHPTAEAVGFQNAVCKKCISTISDIYIAKDRAPYTICT